MPTRWQVAAITGGFFTAAVLLASLVLVLLPDPGTAAGHSGATPGAAAASPSSGLPTSPGATGPGGVPFDGSGDPGSPGAGGGNAAPDPSTDPSDQPTSTVSGSTKLAGRIQPGVTYQGIATSYAADGGGNCMFDPSGDLMVAAMNRTDYESAKACGAHLLVKAGGKSVTVRITDQCPDCTVGQLELSAQAFQQLATPSTGQLAVTWQLVSPATSQTIGIRYKAGSTKTWCAIQVLGHRNPLAMVEVRSGNAWKSLPRSDYNYFISTDGTGCGGSIRVTDIFGQKLTLSGVSLKPDAVQTSKVQFPRH
ncbi:MAG TPA: expansin EXLX1 family cellulose-binding protein [Kineosporiaceae bacterium]|nr:expansin EXLX1 family cellulose-binding protein [Kineosporiaceae bacterium]